MMSDAGFGNKSLAIGQRRYLGSKTRLLTFIDEILETEQAQYTSFADIFAGTGVVAHYFYRKAHVTVNDILESNYQCYQAFFGKQRLRTPWLMKKLAEYNALDPAVLPPNYFSEHFAGTYFDEPNTRRIGHIREDIEQLAQAGTISQRERAYLITSLLYGLDRIANTVGHYDAYRKVAMAPRPLQLLPLLIAKHPFKTNIYQKDANQLVRDIQTDVVYIDPPYNSRQYSDAYHLLENIAHWKKEPVYGVAKKIDRAHIKSQYSLKSAGNAFSDLINNIHAKYILVSYNDMGTSGDARSQSRISDHELVSALERRGAVTIHEKPFAQFTTGRSKRDDLKERVFFCRVQQGHQARPARAVSLRNTHRPAFVKSPLNYTGGKHKLLPQLAACWPADIATFYDVFCGGANVTINAPGERIVGIDKDKHVIQLLKLMKGSNFETLHQDILRVIEQYGLSQSYVHGYDHYEADSSRGLGAYNKAGFAALRSAYNAAPASEKPLLLLVLILYSFNNQIRFNTKGEFNLPVGKRDYNGSSRRNLANFNAVANLKAIQFVAGDFRDMRTMQLHPKDFVYLDPPYLLGLAGYNESGGWSERDEQDLHAVLSDLHQRNIRFALSNVMEHKGQTNTLLLDWARHAGFTVHELDYHYKNANYQSTAKHGVTREVLVTNY